MLGAITGDIVGSRFEWNNHKTKEFDFLSPACFVTDDSVMTLAVAKAILESGKDEKKLGKAAIRCMQEVGRHYPDCGYGGMFRSWINAVTPLPYNSFGNGAAMRVSACGFCADTLEEAKQLSHEVTVVSHNHREGLKGAEATVAAIFLAREGRSIPEIREHISENYYPMNFTLNAIRDTYRFNETCQQTVPQAVMAFLESDSFEDAIRNAISIGGDSDTLAAITGGIAEAYYGIPEDIADKTLAFLDDRLRDIYSSWQAFIGTGK